MSVTKTFSISIIFEKDTVGLKTSGSSQGSSETIAALTESDSEYTEIRKKVLAAIEGTIPLSQGDVSAHIVGTVSES